MSASKLCLGTVQIGLTYGVNNNAGKPKEDEVFAILTNAITNGVRYFDTAAAYGDAEKLLGKYHIGDKDAKIISKLASCPAGACKADTEKVIEKALRCSLRNLKLKAIDGYLLHNPQDFYQQKVMQTLVKYQARGLINNIGVSVYSVQEAIDAASSRLVNYIQIPYNVFDRRLDDSSFFELAQKNNMIVFARSAYLQGLLLMEEDVLPAYLQEVAPLLRQFAEIARKYSFSKKQAALLFPYTHPGINYVVCGVDNTAQMAENMNICEMHDKFMDCRKELSRNFQKVNEFIISPNLWRQRK